MREQLITTYAPVLSKHGGDRLTDGMIQKQDGILLSFLRGGFPFAALSTPFSTWMQQTEE